MNRWSKFLLMAVLVSTVAVSAKPAWAALRRHYYSSWSYHSTNSYYYRSYYYKPSASYEGYRYHYCVYQPAQPRYVYYYNPYSQQYWGRYDLQEKGYSMLEEKDRKASLKEIPDSAFPKPGAMPAIPESEDGEKIPAITADDLPVAAAPKDAPK